MLKWQKSFERTAGPCPKPRRRSVHSPDEEFDIEPLKVQCPIWNLLAQTVIEPFQEPCIINAGTLNGSPKAGALG